MIKKIIFILILLVFITTSYYFKYLTITSTENYIIESGFSENHNEVLVKRLLISKSSLDLNVGLLLYVFYLLVSILYFKKIFNSKKWILIPLGLSIIYILIEYLLFVKYFLEAINF